MRVNAIDTVAAYFTTVPELLDLDLLVKSCIDAVRDPRPEIQKRVYLFIGKMCENRSAVPVLAEHIGKLVDATKDVETVDTSRRESTEESNDAFLMMLARLHVALINYVKDPSFEALFEAWRLHDRMKKNLEDAEFAIMYKTNRVQSESRSAGYALMEKWCPDAVAIFT
jgi:hypothetical protein